MLLTTEVTPASRVRFMRWQLNNNTTRTTHHTIIPIPTIRVCTTGKTKSHRHRRAKRPAPGTRGGPAPRPCLSSLSVAPIELLSTCVAVWWLVREQEAGLVSVEVCFAYVHVWAKYGESHQTVTRRESAVPCTR
jgi:hypothetical protein